MPGPTSVLEIEQEVANQVAAPAETRNTQLAASKSSSMTADGRVATAATGQRENLVYETKSQKNNCYAKN